MYMSVLSLQIMAQVQKMNPVNGEFLALIHGFFNGFETIRINQYLKVAVCPVTPEPAETRIKGWG